MKFLKKVNTYETSLLIIKHDVNISYAQYHVYLRAHCKLKLMICAPGQISIVLNEVTEENA